MLVLFTALATLGGIALLVAVLRTWYWNRSQGIRSRTNASLFGLAAVSMFTATFVACTFPTMPNWTFWAFAPTVIAGVAGLFAAFRDRARPTGIS